MVPPENTRIYQGLWTLAPERFEAYRKAPNEPNLNCLARYCWNISVSAALYSSFAHLEVALRNRIHNAMMERFGADWHFNASLPEYSQRAIEEAIRKIENRYPDPALTRIMAELPFGFWTSFFSPGLESSILRHIIHDVFPDRPPGTRLHRPEIATHLRDIREFRNRISHHEPIIFKRNLKETHRSAVNLLSWLSTDLYEISQKTDRFNSEFGKSWTHHLQHIHPV